MAFGLALTGAAAHLAFGSHCFAAESDPPPEQRTVREAHQQLLSTKVFAFGGVGFAGTTSEAEKAFHIVAAGTNALELFTALLRNGSSEAQMYGLCGIRSLVPQSFDSKARPIVSANLKVNTMSGCLLADERASNVVARIAAGAYDLHISLARIH
jgi:hypothetical protein